MRTYASILKVETSEAVNSDAKTYFKNTLRNRVLGFKIMYSEHYSIQIAK